MPALTLPAQRDRCCYYPSKCTKVFEIRRGSTKSLTYLLSHWTTSWILITLCLLTCRFLGELDAWSSCIREPVLAFSAQCSRCYYPSTCTKLFGIRRGSAKSLNNLLSHWTASCISIILCLLIYRCSGELGTWSSCISKPVLAFIPCTV